jgi:glutaconyl-CoA/methylmalonyl-CoA decarboxylase subunit gamma
MMKKFRVTVDGKPYNVTVEVPDESDGGAASVPGSASVISAPAPATSQAVAPPTPAIAVANVGSSLGDVPSPLAGRVIAIVAKVGLEVKENDHLLTLEAMKMNTFVFAPKAGKILEIKTAVGDAVVEGQALVRIR